MLWDSTGTNFKILISLRILRHYGREMLAASESGAQIELIDAKKMYQQISWDCPYKSVSSHCHFSKGICTNQGNRSTSTKKPIKIQERIVHTPAVFLNTVQIQKIQKLFVFKGSVQRKQRWV